MRHQLSQVIRYLRVLIRVLIAPCLLIALVSVPTQGQAITMIDLAGMNPPEAAAHLNKIGLRLGTQLAAPWTTESPYPAGTIGQQSIAPGTSVEAGSTVDVTILSAANVRLIYDDNDLTMMNQTGASMDITRISFNTADGTRRFNGSRWRGSIADRECTQVWSIARTGAKAVDGCENTFWMTTNRGDEHFWMQGNGNATFSVTQDGIERGVCPTAPPNSQDQPTVCEFFVLGGDSSQVTSHVYFAYTTDRIAIINNTTDRWMPLNETTLYNFNPNIQNPGAGVNISDLALFRNPDIVADVARLAPGQCTMFTLAPLTNAEPPQPCDVIAQRELDPSVAFWTAPFELDSPQGQRTQCPAPTPGRLTLCIMPR
ncbi:MAG: PASTA domain-containing protein [Anaerolineae bacterium]|nr:PASTA domain-containing protein [Anaerolineae bacterium]